MLPSFFPRSLPPCSDLHTRWQRCCWARWCAGCSCTASRAKWWSPSTSSWPRRKTTPGSRWARGTDSADSRVSHTHNHKGHLKEIRFPGRQSCCSVVGVLMILLLITSGIASGQEWFLMPYKVLVEASSNESFLTWFLPDNLFSALWFWSDHSNNEKDLTSCYFGIKKKKKSLLFVPRFNSLKNSVFVHRRV